MKSKVRSSIPRVVVSLVAGCAANTTEIQPAYVSQVPNEDYTCDQIAAEVKWVSREADVAGDEVGVPEYARPPYNRTKIILVKIMAAA
jgi:hypothetical protein